MKVKYCQNLHDILFTVSYTKEKHILNQKCYNLCMKNKKS